MCVTTHGKTFFSICPLLASLYMGLPEIYKKAVLSPSSVLIISFFSQSTKPTLQALHRTISISLHHSHQALASIKTSTTTNMQFTTILSVLSMAMAASALPNPTTSPSCNAGQVVACCDSIDSKSVGINCLASSTSQHDMKSSVFPAADCISLALNILQTVCTGGQSVACCSPTVGFSPSPFPCNVLRGHETDRVVSVVVWEFAHQCSVHQRQCAVRWRILVRGRKRGGGRNILKEHL